MMIEYNKLNHKKFLRRIILSFLIEIGIMIGFYLIVQENWVITVMYLFLILTNCMAYFEPKSLAQTTPKMVAQTDPK